MAARDQKGTRHDAGRASDAAAWYEAGFDLHAMGDLSGAEDAYRQAIALDAACAPAWFNLGNVLADAGREAAAAEAYRRALDLDPRDHETWNNLGVALSDVPDPGALREAVRCFETALILAPDYHPAWNNLGYAVEAALGDLARAAEAYRQAIALDAERADYHLNLASALCRMERSSEGRRHLDDALRRDPALRKVVPAFPEFDGLF